VGRTSAEPGRIAFLGFGLIAGSIALTLRERLTDGGQTLVAWTPDGRGPRAGLAAGALDDVAPTAAAAIADADLVVLAAPPTTVLRMLDDLGGSLGAALAPGATITDVGSTKARILERADAHGLPFVGGHPMAGREASGFEAATADLFVDRPWVVVPGGAATANDVERVDWLAMAVGARPIRMTAEDHDRAVAAISHVPLVLAAALVEAIAGADAGSAPRDWATARGLAASGWADMTRLARGDAAMGAGILATNGPAVAARLQDLRRVLDEWIAELEISPAVEARLRARLAGARARLEEPGAADAP
jgi:prephenate dehydrogenase